MLISYPFNLKKKIIWFLLFFKKDFTMLWTDNLCYPTTQAMPGSTACYLWNICKKHVFKQNLDLLSWWMSPNLLTTVKGWENFLQMAILGTFLLKLDL